MDQSGRNVQIAWISVLLQDSLYRYFKKRKFAYIFLATV